MSLDYQIDGDTIVVTIHGSAFYEETARTFESITADPAFKKPARILFDGRHTDYGPPTDEIHAMAERLGGMAEFDGSSWAMVAAPDTLMYGLGRMFASFLEMQGFSGALFDDINKARKWLRRR